MIRNFTNRDTEQLFRTERNRRFNAIARVALRKRIQMNQAGKLSDLAVPTRQPPRSPQGRARQLPLHPHQLPMSLRFRAFFGQSETF